MKIIQTKDTYISYKTSILSLYKHTIGYIRSKAPKLSQHLWPPHKPNFFLLLVLQYQTSAWVCGGSPPVQQLGPQQLKYMTVLRDSSDFFALWSSLIIITFLLETTEDGEGDSFLACSWELNDLTWFLACWCTDFMEWFHLQIPWSFKASTTPTLAATNHALLVAPLIFSIAAATAFWENWEHLTLWNNYGFVEIYKNILCRDGSKRHECGLFYRGWKIMGRSWVHEWMSWRRRGQKM